RASGGARAAAASAKNRPAARVPAAASAGPSAASTAAAAAAAVARAPTANTAGEGETVEQRGPRRAPFTPVRSERPGEPVALLDIRRHLNPAHHYRQPHLATSPDDG